MTSRLNPYIQFAAEAKQAFEFYRSVFGGELTMMTFGEMGAEGPEADKVMHVMLTTPEGFVLMGSDTPEGMERSSGSAISISLSGDNADALRSYFAGLSDGGDVTLELKTQMWGDEFGMLTDRFGVAWMVNIQSSELRQG